MYQLVDFIRLYPDIAQAIGVLGFMIYIASFFSVQCGHLCGNGILFPILQVSAATCVLISLASAYNLASFMIQTSYIAIGLMGIALRLRRVRANRHRPPNPARPSRLRRPGDLVRPVGLRPLQDSRAECHKPAMQILHAAE